MLENNPWLQNVQGCKSLTSHQTAVKELLSAEVSVYVLGLRGLTPATGHVLFSRLMKSSFLKVVCFFF